MPSRGGEEQPAEAAEPKKEVGGCEGRGRGGKRGKWQEKGKFVSQAHSPWVEEAKETKM